LYQAKFECDFKEMLSSCVKAKDSKESIPRGSGVRDRSVTCDAGLRGPHDKSGVKRKWELEKGAALHLKVGEGKKRRANGRG